MSLSTRSIPEPAVTPHFSLAEVLWPDRAEGVSGVLRIVILIALGTALLTLSAKVNLPLPYVPMTLQTLVVLMIGAAYGGSAAQPSRPIWRWGRSDGRCSPVPSAASRRWWDRPPAISSVSSPRLSSRDG
jgi:hypothetical protein